MSNLSVFDFEGYEVRFAGTSDKPEWVAADIARILGIQNIRQNLASMDDYQKGVCIVDTPGGKQEMATVTESGLYALIFTSRKDESKRFQRWVFEEVLPQIRKTGSYGARPGFEWFERVKLYRRHTKIPTGWFSIFEEMCSGLMADFEDAGYSLPMGSVPDISVGKCFCNHLRSLGHGLTPGSGLIQEYQHHYPDGRVVTANIYNDSLLPDYRRWFKDVYSKEKLPVYLKSKDPLALPSLCRLLQLPEGTE